MEAVRGLAVVVVVLVLGQWGTAPVSSAADATCRGLPVTLVADANVDSRGTAGDDVILAFVGTKGYVDAGLGDDVVCAVPGDPVSGHPGPREYAIFGAEGDDVIDSTALTDDVNLAVPAQPGSDQFYGGPERDRVQGYFATGAPLADTDVDIYVTGEGADYVESGQMGLANEDHIDLGPGDDLVAYAGSVGPGRGVLAGGPGQDALRPSSIDWVDGPDPLPPGEAVFDNRTGTATIGGGALLTWTGFEWFDFTEVTEHELTFTGSEVEESVVLGGGVVHAAMGDGDDQVSNTYPQVPEGHVTGGGGRDQLRIDVDAQVAVDLAREVSMRTGDATTLLSLAGFEDASVQGRSVRLEGTRGPNRLWAAGQVVVEVRGRAGADRIQLIPSRTLLSGNQRRARGGVGRDVLIGSPGRDELYGGRGRDVAKGREGRDLCVAETRVSCELPPRLP